MQLVLDAAEGVIAVLGHVPHRIDVEAHLVVRVEIEVARVASRIGDLDRVAARVVERARGVSQAVGLAGLAPGLVEDLRRAVHPAQEV